MTSDHSPHAIIQTDLTGAITFWNAAAEQLYGWTTAEALGQNVINLIPTNASRDDATTIMSELVRGKSWSGIFEVRTRAGKTLRVHVTDTPICNDFGELVAIVGESYPA